MNSDKVLTWYYVKVIEYNINRTGFINTDSIKYKAKFEATTATQKERLLF